LGKFEEITPDLNTFQSLSQSIPKKKAWETKRVAVQV
jgi:hypothetical protein